MISWPAFLKIQKNEQTYKPSRNEASIIFWKIIFWKIPLPKLHIQIILDIRSSLSYWEIICRFNYSISPHKISYISHVILHCHVEQIFPVRRKCWIFRVIQVLRNIICCILCSFAYCSVFSTERNDHND